MAHAMSETFLEDPIIGTIELDEAQAKRLENDRASGVWHYLVSDPLREDRALGSRFTCVVVAADTDRLRQELDRRYRWLRRLLR